MRRVENYSLWLGHAGEVVDSLSLSAQGIVAVVDLALNEPPAIFLRDLIYCRFPLTDGSGNASRLLRAAIESVAALVRAGTPTFVFCSAGMSRSPCIAAAALALVDGCSATDALRLVIQSGPADISPKLWSDVQTVLGQLQSDRMHSVYRQRAEQRQAAAQIVYREPACPHAGCGEPMQAIDFRLEDHGRAVHDPLVRAWWNDTGFVGRCPHCGRWIHFTIRSKRAITDHEAADYPHLPDDWHGKATVL